MVVSKVEFNQAMEQLNDAFREVWKRLEALEQKVDELTPKKTTARKAASDGNE